MFDGGDADLHQLEVVGEGLEVQGDVHGLIQGGHHVTEHRPATISFCFCSINPKLDKHAPFTSEDIFSKFLYILGTVLVTL